MSSEPQPNGSPHESGLYSQWQEPEPVGTSGLPDENDPGTAAKGMCEYLTRLCNSSFELVPELAHGFTHRDDDILKEMQNEYGPKVGIYFAFLNCYTTSAGMMAVIGAIFINFPSIFDRFAAVLRLILV